MRSCSGRTCARACSSRRSIRRARAQPNSPPMCAASTTSGEKRSATPASSPNSVQEKVEAIYRAESRRVFATLVRLLGDFDVAEEALHDAFRAALEQWPVEGVPANPRAWLVSTGRFKAIDGIRRRARFDSIGDFEALAETIAAEPQPEREPIEDDRLRLIFTCCHPALAP